jgi:2,5-diketo-D-gluconate reductase A
VTDALAAGYRSIDTAMIYDNERGVGAALAASGIPRDELFVTTKAWNTDQGHDSTLAAFDLSMSKLGLDHLDLYLIHWPTPARDLYVETWRALERLQSEGRVRSIGVSNFHPAHLQRLLDETDVVPAVNQIELHPLLPQDEPRAFHAAHGIATEAWSPLARGGDLLGDPVVTGIADRLERTPAQVVLAWHLALGNIVIPKSVTPARIRENIDVFDIELSEDDMAAIATLSDGSRTGPNPDEFNAA